MLVHEGEPGFGSFLVVGAGDLPVVVDLEVVLKVEEEVVGRHLATSEEVAGHPVVFVFGFVVVGVFAVGEDVDKEFSAGFEPGGDAL